MKWNPGTMILVLFQRPGGGPWRNWRLKAAQRAIREPCHLPTTTSCGCLPQNRRGPRPTRWSAG